MKKLIALAVFLICSLQLSAESAKTVRVSVVMNLPTATSFIWTTNSVLTGNAHKPVTCSGFDCTAYITAPLPQSRGGAIQATVKLLMPDGSIDIVGCFRKPVQFPNSTPFYTRPCRVPEEGSTMDAVFVGKSGQVNLTIPNPGKEGKSYREMYFVIGVLHPTGSSSNVGGATDHP